MSGLAALLAGHNPPDLYQWHSAAHVPDVEHAVEHAGWAFVHLDGWTVEDKESFLKAAVQAFGLEDDRGASFDALSDGLADVDAARHVRAWCCCGTAGARCAATTSRRSSVALSVLGGRVNADRGCPLRGPAARRGPRVDPT